MKSMRIRAPDLLPKDARPVIRAASKSANSTDVPSLLQCFAGPIFCAFAIWAAIEIRLEPVTFEALC